MQTNNDLITLPLCLTLEEQKNPQLALSRLFDVAELEYLRLELWYFLKAVIHQDYFRLMGQPIIVCEVVDHFKQLIDVFYLLLENVQGAGQENHDFKLLAVSGSGEADRKYMLDLENILADHGGRIRRLRKEEIENLYLVAKNFFRFHSRNDWSEKLKHWQYYALSADSICVASDETNMLEMYEHLEKLLEAAYLLHQRGTMEYVCAEQVAKNDYSAKRQRIEIPVFLTVQEQSEPFVYICDYFGGNTLTEQTWELSEWILAVFGDYIWNLRNPGELVFFYEETVKLIEAAFELYNQKESGVEWIVGAIDFRRPLKEPSGYRIYPHYLNEKEIGDPWLVLEKLCRHKLHIYHKLLRNWLYQALKPGSLIDPQDDLYFYNLLQKLAEALYILSVGVSNALEDETN